MINDKVMKRLKAKLLKQKCVLKTIGGANFTKGRAKLQMRINKKEEVIDVYVVRNNNFSYDLLLGLDAIKRFGLIQDENLYILQRVGENRIERIGTTREVKSTSETHKNKCSSHLFNSETENIQVLTNEYVSTKEFCDGFTYLSAGKREKIANIIGKYEKVFATDKFDIGTVNQFEAQIKLQEYRYISKKPYRCSIPDQAEIDSQVAQLLERNLIEESSSPFAAPVTLAFKKGDNRRSRLCIDFRELNKVVVPESQPFPRIEDIMVKAGRCCWFSTFDVNSAFWSIPIREKDKEKTAFVTQTGHYQWARLPFGLKISPAIFQRTLSNLIRKNNLSDFCINYIDGILVYSRSFDEHLRHIETLMKTIMKSGFKLKLTKCDFARQSVQYLGHILEKNSVRPAEDNLKAIRDFERPKTKKNIRQLLGKVNFYYKYIENACRLLEPLHNLLRKGSEFNWTDDCERAFRNIKDYLCSSPILRIYDPNKPVIIYTDASGDGVGAILKQPEEDNFLHPVAYFSRRLTPAERKKKQSTLSALRSNRPSSIGNTG